MASLIAVFASCDLEVDDEIPQGGPVKSFESPITVWLGGESNTQQHLTGSYVLTKGGVAAAPVNFDIELGLYSLTWDDTSVELNDGDSVAYTFAQSAKGTEFYRSWEVFFENATQKRGNILRGDGVVNQTDKWPMGLWTDATGWPSAGVKYAKNFTNINTAQNLEPSSSVVMTVTRKDLEMEITQTIDGTPSFTCKTNDWEKRLF